MPVAACGHCDSRFCVETEEETQGTCPFCGYPMIATTVHEAVEHFRSHESQPVKNEVIPLLANQNHREKRLLTAQFAENQVLVKEACERSKQLVAALQESRDKRRRQER